MSSIREAQKIFQAISDAELNGHPSCLLMITTVKGSAYRRPGAKMMMAQGGLMVGTLSGGCLEGDLYHWAEEVMKTQKPQIHHYNLAEDDMWGLGIGCKGEIDVLIEPVTVHQSFWLGFAEALQDDTGLLLVMELPDGDRFYQGVSGKRVSLGGQLSDDVSGWSFPVHGQTVRKGTAIWDYLVPPARLVVAGAGHDAKPVVELASRVGFDVYVLDSRQLFNNPREFPWATNWIADEKEMGESDDWYGAFWLIMNHHQARDEAALSLALRSHPRYVGVLGPLSRTRDMLKKLEVTSLAGVPLFAPVGMDLGGEIPEEVAVSIISEMMMIRQQTAGGHLTGRETIHLTS